ncbi:MAG TPA: BamA/TamA family outer membrane protein [Vicinamibacterales bacterium]|jgi:hypothetical protein|nr:BamA/TamA family outer membrane protein [Vicinamibacterales bacterium]
MSRRFVVILFLFAATFSVDTVATAQQQATSAARSDDASTHLTDVGDVWRHLRHKSDAAATSSDRTPAQTAKHPFFFFSPSFGSKPSTGLQIGLASSVVFVAGDPKTTRISSGDWAVSDSVKGQAGTSLRFRIFTPGNRWFLQADNRLAWSSQETYALGIVADATAEKLKYQRRRIYDTIFRQARPKLFIGAGLNVNEHADVRAGSGTADAFAQSAYVAYSSAHGFALDRQISSGTSVGMFVDTRDNSINASRGWFASATYRSFFKGFLGGDASWQLLDLDARTYRSLGHRRRQTIGVWMLGELVTRGAAPYLDLPAIADDTYGRSARAYTTARYRGPHQVYGEVEYRTSLTANGLLGAVAFANAAAIDGETPDQKLFSSVAPAAGGGLRVLLSKRSRANLCADYGWGTNGSRGLYLAVRETF